MPVVLIATDGSRAALAAEATGLDLARAQAATAVMLSVWAPLHGSFGVPIPEFLDPEFLDAERVWAQETVDAAAARAAASGVTVETLVAKGSTVEEVCRVARDRDASLVVLGSEGWSAVVSLILGRTTLGVLGHAPCPVVVVRDPAQVARDRS
jgi:nucleotide-binding universal stress UspA family protein